MPARQAQYMLREAKQAGISVSGKQYIGGLADRRGWRDPEAWVSNNDDILRVAKKRQLAVRGNVNYDPGEVPPKRTLLAESIIRQEVKKLRKKMPTAKTRELRERVIDKHAYRAKGRA
jgi:hypothetical protein